MENRVTYSHGPQTKANRKLLIQHLTFPNGERMPKYFTDMDEAITYVRMTYKYSNYFKYISLSLETEEMGTIEWNNF